ncbi:4'-phosphopantetheinyl transferase superfamily protein [uncultured Chryseobacterium sp.]|uniref:4'-phosphopantetheinyl transferase family protein n=1 Tax=uncultured Chryseobacterium sp. TaxID=259322 RepID=UPI00258271FB|nr:4'-phosphopantetheinyl transferase superfamily protein [uncultured Chryseobacterium sp.]
MIILYTIISREKHESLLNKYLPAFSQEDRQNILRYRRWQDAQLSLLGKLLLQYGLRTHYNIAKAETGILPNRKPYLKNHNVHFNISHSRELVVCAIAEYPLGIDIEFNDPKVSYHDFKFQMTGHEFQEIDSSDNKTKEFFTCWTRKEAVIKAHGAGMTIPLDTFEIIKDECSIEGERFFTRAVFIHEDYHSYVASSNHKIKDEVAIITYFEAEM